jgi:antitoxin component YwqK of YwqJK toxin-antitoxin module
MWFFNLADWWQLLGLFLGYGFIFIGVPYLFRSLRRSLLPVVDANLLQKRKPFGFAHLPNEENAHLPNEEKPFTGVAVSKWTNGQKAGKSTYKDGKKHGLATGWYENGQKEFESTYKDGKEHGLWTYWHDNGQKKTEATFKYGERFSEKEWDKDGNPLGQDPWDEVPPAVVDAPKVVVDVDQLGERNGLIYVEGKPFTGVAVEKYSNGQKWYEFTYKDGKEHGLWTHWYENGQKETEATFKDGERFSEKEWDVNGNPL